MGGLYSREYVTGPFTGSGGSVIVELANTADVDSLAAPVIMPGSAPGDGATVPASSVLTITLDMGSGKQPPFQGWVSIFTQSDRIVPTVTLAPDVGETQVYRPGDLLVFDLTTGARLW